MGLVQPIRGITLYGILVFTICVRTVFAQYSFLPSCWKSIFRCSISLFPYSTACAFLLMRCLTRCRTVGRCVAHKVALRDGFKELNLGIVGSEVTDSFRIEKKSVADHPLIATGWKLPVSKKPASRQRLRFRNRLTIPMKTISCTYSKQSLWVSVSCW